MLRCCPRWMSEGSAGAWRQTLSLRSVRKGQLHPPRVVISSVPHSGVEYRSSQSNASALASSYLVVLSCARCSIPRAPLPLPRYPFHCPSSLSMSHSLPRAPGPDASEGRRRSGHMCGTPSTKLFKCPLNNDGSSRARRPEPSRHRVVAIVVLLVVVTLRFMALVFLLK